MFDLKAALAAEYAKKRAEKKRTPEEFRKEVARVSGAVRIHYGVSVAPTGERSISRDGYQITKYLVMVSGVPVPAIQVEEKDAKGVKPWVIRVSDRGIATDGASGGPIEKIVKGGRSVFALDLPGWGETAPARVAAGKAPPFGVEYREAFLALHLNRPLLSHRAGNLLHTCAMIPHLEDAELIGIDSAAIAVLHVAALDDRIKSVTLDGGLVSWENVVRTPISHNQLAGVVPGALKVYDLPDLAASLAPRPLTIRNPADAAGKPLSKKAAEEAYKSVREAYKKAGAADKFTLVIGAK